MSRPSNLEILAYDDTPLGLLCLRRRELLSEPGTLVTEVTLNHEFLMSSYLTDSERAIANRSVALHGGRDLRALVGGLGLGYTAYELLVNDRVAAVEVVEFLPQVINWLQDGLVPLSEALHGAEGLAITRGDVYQRLLDPPQEAFDLIVIDVDHSPTDQLTDEEHPFYTVAGLAGARQHLRDNGVLAVWSYAESSAFSQALGKVFRRVHVEEVTVFNKLINVDQTDWLFFGVR